jgi:photosystem II stability/assembly factor-like uncharacterized protein
MQQISKFGKSLLHRLAGACVKPSASQLPVSAGFNAWTSIGPEGGWIYALAVDPTTPTTLYAGTYGGGVFKSTDGGATWSAVNTGLTNKSVWALAIDPTAPNTLYAGTYGGVFKSTNGGASWSAVNSGLTNTAVFALAIDPTDSNTLYAGTYGGGVFKSINGGTTWSATGAGPTNVLALAIDPSTPTTLYAGTKRRRVQEHGRRHELERNRRGPTNLSSSSGD